MIAQPQTSSGSPVRMAAVDQANASTVGVSPKLVEIEDLGRRMICDLEAFLSEALRSSTERVWFPAGGRIIGCNGISCPRCRSVAGNSAGG